MRGTNAHDLVKVPRHKIYDMGGCESDDSVDLERFIVPRVTALTLIKLYFLRVDCVLSCR